MKKIRKNIMMTETLDQMIRELSEESGINQSTIISNAIHYYFKQEAVDYPKIGETLQLLFDNNFKQIHEELKRIRFAINQLAKESKMNMEFWNNHYLNFGNGDIYTTDIKKASEVKKTEESVQQKLLKAQQKKYS